MASSPYTPRHSRNSSAIDSFSGSPRSRRFSKSSLQDPSSPYRNSLSQADVLELNGLTNGGVAGGSGMGNLADELADAFSESGNEEDYDDEERFGGILEGPEGTKEGDQSLKEGDLAIPMNQRQTSRYDGSEYGSESDLESSGIPPGLVAKMDAVDSLARRGMDNYGSPADNAFSRVMDGLRDLGSQSSVEASASRSGSGYCHAHRSTG